MTQGMATDTQELSWLSLSYRTAKTQKAQFLKLARMGWTPVSTHVRIVVPGFRKL